LVLSGFSEGTCTTFHGVLLFHENLEKYLETFSSDTELIGSFKKAAKMFLIEKLPIKTMYKLATFVSEIYVFKIFEYN